MKLSQLQIPATTPIEIEKPSVDDLYNYIARLSETESCDCETWEGRAINAHVHKVTYIGSGKSLNAPFDDGVARAIMHLRKNPNNRVCEGWLVYREDERWFIRSYDWSTGHIGAFKGARKLAEGELAVGSFVPRRDYLMKWARNLVPRCYS